MSHEHPEGAGPRGPEQMSEEELRARLEEEMKRITVHDVLLQTVVSLVNLAGQRLGLAEGTRELRDLGQVRMGIDAIRALLPLLEQDNPEQVRPVRDALAQLQMAYAREAGAEEPGGEEPGGGSPGSGGGEGPPGGAQRPRPAAPPPGAPGGLWVPPGSTK